VQHNIQAFLGVPILVSGKVYGTLNFHSQKPHDGPFSVSDQEFMRLMGQWINSELEHEQYLVKLKSYNDEIAQKNEELGIARDQALEVSRLKSEFLATMSHEIRTPMNAVIGMTEILLGTNLSGEQQEYATIVRDSAQVLLTLINDILDFSKIEAGKLLLEKVEFDPVSLVEGAVEMFSTKANQKNLHLMTYVSPRVPELLMGDPVRLRQVLMNLIGNALKFTEHGEVVVRAEIAGSSEQEMLLRFEVKDTGIGLSEVARKRLFQPFTQADGSITRKYGGTGLGLAISKRLVELMGGEIGVDSVEHEGSTFWFTVRLGLTSLAESKLQPKTTPDQQLAGTHLIIVDDNQSQREIAQKYLSSLGIRCDAAPDGATAFSILEEAQKRRDPVLAAILDLDMPGEDGFSLAKRILSSKKLRNTRLILLTAFDQRDQAEKAREIGFSAYLTKPVKQTVLINTIKQVMAGGEFQTPGRWTQPVDHNAAIQVERLTESIHKPEQSRGLILLAEDNPANQKLAMIQLQKLGFNAEAVSTGAQAVEKILADPERYTLALMDCQMPELDGFEATRQVRAAETRSGKHTTIIAMTANAMQGDRELCIAAGMDDYLSKPVTLEGLQRVIHEWIEHKQTTHPEKPQAASTAPVPQIKVEAAQSPLDMEMIEGIRALQEEGEPDLLTDLIDMYLGDSAGQIEQMHKAFENRDYELLRRTAHTLKGTSGNLGAKGLYTLCAEMEKLARENLDAEIPAGMQKIELEFGRVKEALMKERKY
jgi:signal transduction histidine kinase/DNA-binding response OmpR family regulator